MQHLLPDNNPQPVEGQIPPRTNQAPPPQAMTFISDCLNTFLQQSDLADPIAYGRLVGSNADLKTRTRIYLQKANEAIQTFNASFAAGN